MRVHLLPWLVVALAAWTPPAPAGDDAPPPPPPPLARMAPDPPEGWRPPQLTAEDVERIVDQALTRALARQQLPQAQASPQAEQYGAAPAPRYQLPAHTQYPGPFRRAVGELGERLARQKMAKVYVPVEPATFVQQAPRVTMPPPVQYAPPVYALPQLSSDRPWPFRIFR